MRISFKPSSAGGLPKNTWRTLDYPQRNSEHLLALAVVAAAHEKRLSVGEPSSFRYTPGKGVRATVDGDAILVGNAALLGRAARDENCGWSESSDRTTGFDASAWRAKLAGPQQAPNAFWIS